MIEISRKEFEEYERLKRLDDKVKKEIEKYKNDKEYIFLQAGMTKEAIENHIKYLMGLYE